jgi:hypothetical protein
MLAIHPEMHGTERTEADGAPGSAPPVRAMTEIELCRWLEEHAEELAERWSVELSARTGHDDGPLADLRDDFLHAMTHFLAPAVGPWRDQVEPLVHQLAALYGNVAALRALAAGDVVEEMQLLREILLRFLFREATPETGARGVELRELLRVSRVVDQVVTHATVGHIDALFFNLLHGTGVTEAPKPGVLEEIRSELGQLRTELDRMRPAREGAAGPPTRA